MPRPPADDDAPRWEPPAPSTEAPRWELTDPDEVPRWEPDRDIPRRKSPAAKAPRAGRAPAAVARRVPPRSVSAAARPFAWWGRHPWVVVWALVLLIPGLAVLLRVVDESRHVAFVRPLAWAFVVLFATALGVAMLASARRSLLRVALGLAACLAVAGILLWPVTRVTLGRTACPSRAGPDLGAPIAAAAMAAWRAGGVNDAGWRGGRADAPWSDRARSLGLIDYQLVASGCWERVAPVDGTRTWHDFRVTVRQGDNTPLSKVVIVHTAAADEEWTITAIEGPLP